jgi:adenosylmethionine-8-amino-7-oxononanoate aminotransferase
MHSLWTGVLPAQVFAGLPPANFQQTYADELAELVGRHAGELAAVIVEPIVQGAGGMRFHHPEYLRVLREVTEAHGVLLIFDEIATGFGRTGSFFAADQAGVSPDIMSVGKALTGGYLSLAATLCTPAVARAISAGQGGGLAHGPTFMGNPLACAVANASIGLLRGRDWAGEVRRIGTGLRAGLEPLRAAPGVADVRVLGAIGVVQLDHDVDLAKATAAAVGAGVWLRPFRDLIYTMPPYVADDADVARITRGIAAAVSAT